MRVKRMKSNSKFKKAYAYFEYKILEPLLILCLVLFGLLLIYVYIETRTNYLNYL